jgi:hypothetical protein
MFQWRRTRIADEGVLLTDSVFERRVKELESENRALKRQLNRYAVLHDQLCDEFNAQTAQLLHVLEQKREVTRKYVAEKQQCEAELTLLRERVQQLEEHALAVEQRCDTKILELHEKMQLAENLLSRILKAEKFLEQISSIECPISMKPMAQPVGMKCGHVFETKAICEWADVDSSCPLCRVGFVRGEHLIPRSDVLSKILMLITKMKQSQDAFRTVYLWDRIKAEFVRDNQNTLMQDPISVPCGALMDRDMIGMYYCFGCDADHKTFTAMPPYLQSVWELVRQDLLV